MLGKTFGRLIREQSNLYFFITQVCKTATSCKKIHFEGDPYNLETLQPLAKSVLKPNQFAICEQCCEKVKLYSKVHHYKYNNHSECKNMVSV